MSISMRGAGGSSFRGRFAFSAVDREKAAGCREYQIAARVQFQGNDVAGPWMPATSEIPLSYLAVALSSSSSPLPLVLISSSLRRPLPRRLPHRRRRRRVQHGKRQRLAKQIAFIAHPHARDIAVLDFHHVSGWPPDFRMTTSPGFKSMICSCIA
jgi:hypothetical protein